jgi:hypothetical protein
MYVAAWSLILHWLLSLCQPHKLAYFEKAHEMVTHELKLYLFVINDEPHFNSMLVGG